MAFQFRQGRYRSLLAPPGITRILEDGQEVRVSKEDQDLTRSLADKHLSTVGDGEEFSNYDAPVRTPSQEKIRLDDIREVIRMLQAVRHEDMEGTSRVLEVLKSQMGPSPKYTVPGEHKARSGLILHEDSDPRTRYYGLPMSLLWEWVIEKESHNERPFFFTTRVFVADTICFQVFRDAKGMWLKPTAKGYAHEISPGHVIHVEREDLDLYHLRAPARGNMGPEDIKKCVDYQKETVPKHWPEHELRGPMLWAMEDNDPRTTIARKGKIWRKVHSAMKHDGASADGLSREFGLIHIIRCLEMGTHHRHIVKWLAQTQLQWFMRCRQIFVPCMGGLAVQSLHGDKTWKVTFPDTSSPSSFHLDLTDFRSHENSAWWGQHGGDVAIEPQKSKTQVTSARSSSSGHDWADDSSEDSAFSDLYAGGKAVTRRSRQRAQVWDEERTGHLTTQMFVYDGAVVSAEEGSRERTQERAQEREPEREQEQEQEWEQKREQEREQEWEQEWEQEREQERELERARVQGQAREGVQGRAQERAQERAQALTKEKSDLAGQLLQAQNTITTMRGKAWELEDEKTFLAARLAEARNAIRSAEELDALTRKDTNEALREELTQVQQAGEAMREELTRARQAAAQANARRAAAEDSLAALNARYRVRKRTTRVVGSCVRNGFIVGALALAGYHLHRGGMGFLEVPTRTLL